MQYALHYHLISVFNSISIILKTDTRVVFKISKKNLCCVIIPKIENVGCIFL